MLVAVYGSLKKGYGNHVLLENSKYLGCTDTYPEWTMYGMGGFPCICMGGETPIHIEVYDVDEGTFQDLDMLEGYPNFYNRLRTPTKFGDAWIYYIKDESEVDHLPIIEHGVW